jgi:putative nucleotidyltransferase with HDIG domain
MLLLSKFEEGVMTAKEKYGISREEALALMEQHIQQDNLRCHCLATEAIMRHLARGFGDDEDLWGLAGLLHDLDYAQTRDDMQRHGLVTESILKELGVHEEICRAIKSHNAAHLGLERSTPFEHALVAAECMTGLVVATALVYPDKKLASVKPSSIVKRMKQKEFARSVNREHIRECELIGIPLDRFAQLSLEAMLPISARLGL